MTYAEQELTPHGFRLVEARGENGAYNNPSKVIMERGGCTVEFTCTCPAHPVITALGCPIHAKTTGSSWPVEDAKRIA